MQKGNPTGDRWTAEHCCDLTAEQVAGLLMVVEARVGNNRRQSAAKLRQASKDCRDAAAAFDDRRESDSLNAGYIAGAAVFAERALHGTVLVNEMRRFIEFHIDESK